MSSITISYEDLKLEDLREVCLTSRLEPLPASHAVHQDAIIAYFLLKVKPF